MPTKAQLENQKLQAEIDAITATRRKTELEAISLQRQDAWLRATDANNFTYRFFDEVYNGSVTICMQQLGIWHRLDPTRPIEIIFCSPGGDVISGMALFDYIQELRQTHKVTTGTMGYAASMAGILLQAGDHRWMGRQSWLMIHEASFGAIGKTSEVIDTVEWVKRVQERILRIFADRSNLSERQVRTKWSRKDWWLDAEQALDLGFADEIR